MNGEIIFIMPDFFLHLKTLVVSIFCSEMIGSLTDQSELSDQMKLS